MHYLALWGTDSLELATEILACHNDNVGPFGDVTLNSGYDACRSLSAGDAALPRGGSHGVLNPDHHACI